jgi:predicted phage terminase large subunit-like protein
MQALPQTISSERLKTFLTEDELEQLAALKNELLIRSAEESLSEYIRQGWPVIEPATRYLHNWHIDAIAEHLEAVTDGQILRLLINMPPRYMKSIAVSVMWPTWEWLKYPDSRWLFVSYSGTLSTKHSLDRRTVIQSEWYQRRWAGIYQLTSDQNVKTEYQNSERGVMVATSVGGSVTGKGGRRIVVDDPHNPTEAQSDVQREAALTFFDQTLSTRLDDKKTGAIVVVMQRLHEADLSAHCMELGYTHLCLPAEAEKRTVITMPVSGREIVREKGDLLWPEREGPNELALVKRALGSYGYAGQYEQSPSPAEGGILKRAWWQYYKAPPARFDEVIQSWDMAFKDLKTSDYVVGQVWGRVGADKYLLDQVRDRLDFPATITAVESLTAKWPNARLKLVEDKANGPAVIAVLHKSIPGLVAVEPEGGKVARVNAVSPDIEAGNVHLPHPSIAPWIHDFVERCAAFPNVAYDDEIDTMSQALTRWITTRSSAPPKSGNTRQSVTSSYRST